MMMDTASLYRIFLEHPAVTTDSRKCPSGSMFFALRGDTFNGNDYALQALEKGCAVAVVSMHRCLCLCDEQIRTKKNPDEIRRDFF